MNHFNSGWVEIAGRPAIGYSTLTSGPVNEIDYNEASTAVFFDATHGVYTAGENEDVWNFTTVWLENEDSYPTLRDARRKNWRSQIPHHPHLPYQRQLLRQYPIITSPLIPLQEVQA